jgi:hypothetical protein
MAATDAPACTTPTDNDAQSHGPGVLDEIKDLQRQLREEKGESSSSSWTKIFQFTLTQKRTGSCIVVP